MGESKFETELSGTSISDCSWPRDRSIVLYHIERNTIRDARIRGDERNGGVHRGWQWRRRWANNKSEGMFPVRVGNASDGTEERRMMRDSDTNRTMEN